MRRAILSIVAAAAMCVPSVASAAVYVFDSTGDSATITIGGDQPGTSSTLYLTVTGISGTSYTFGYTVTNTSNSSTNPFARVSGFGFVANPLATSGSVSGGYTNLVLNPAAGQLGSEISADGLCVSNANGNSCSGSGGATIGTPATGTLVLNYSAAPASLSLSDFGVRYQSLGLNGDGSGRGFEISVPPVPEPATWALMLLGFGAIGVGIRRSRRQGKLATA